MAGFSDFNLRSIQSSRGFWSEMLSVVNSRDFNETSPDIGCQREKCIRKKIRDLQSLARLLGGAKRPSFGRFNASGGDACILFRTHREEKQGRLCANGSWNEGRLDRDFPRSPCRSLDTGHEMTRVCCNKLPSSSGLFRSIISLRCAYFIPYLKIPQNLFLELMLPALIYLRATIQIFISRNITSYQPIVFYARCISLVYIV